MMGCCTLCSKLTGRTRGEIQDRGLRRVYESGPRDSFQRVRDRLRGRVLEVGCGTGILFSEYPSSAQVTAIEKDRDFLPLARERAQGAAASVRLVAANAQHLPFADRAFDAAVFHLVLCTIEDPRRALEEAHRVVRPGGLFYFYEHVISRSRAYSFVQNMTDPITSWMAEGCHWNRDTGAVIRSLPIDIESDERDVLRAHFLPPFPIVRIVARRR